MNFNVCLNCGNEQVEPMPCKACGYYDNLGAPKMEGTQAEQTAVKMLEKFSTSKSFAMNIFLASEIVKAYGREVLEMAANAAPEAAARIRALRLK